MITLSFPRLFVCIFIVVKQTKTCRVETVKRQLRKMKGQKEVRFMTYEEIRKELEGLKEEMMVMERMMGYIRGEEVDHIPFRLVGSDTTADLYGYTLKQYRDSMEIRFDIMEKMHEEFGNAAIGIGLGLQSVGEALGSKMQYPENGLGFVTEHVLTDYAQLDDMEVIKPAGCPNLAEIMDTFRKSKERFPRWGAGNNVAGPMTTATSIRRLDLLLRDSVKQKENLHRLLDFCVQCNLSWIRAVTEEFGVLPVNIAEPSASLSVLSRKQFLEFEKPHLKDLVEGIKEITGRMPTTHICGKTKGIWEDLIELGFTSLSVDNSEDLEEVKRCVGGRMSISGNVPPVEVLKYGTIDDVIASVIDCLKKGSDSPMGYSLAAGCQVPPGVPRENLYAFIYAARKYGRGAKKGRLPRGLSDVL